MVGKYLTEFAPSWSARKRVQEMVKFQENPGNLYSGRAPLAHPLFSAPLVLAHLLGVPFYSFYLTKPVLFSAPPPLAHLLGVPKRVR